MNTAWEYAGTSKELADDYNRSLRERDARAAGERARAAQPVGSPAPAPPQGLPASLLAMQAAMQGVMMPGQD